MKFLPALRNSEMSACRDVGTRIGSGRALDHYQAIAIIAWAMVAAVLLLSQIDRSRQSNSHERLGFWSAAHSSSVATEASTLAAIAMAPLCARPLLRGTSTDCTMYGVLLNFMQIVAMEQITIGCPWCSASPALKHTSRLYFGSKAFGAEWTCNGCFAWPAAFALH